MKHRSPFAVFFLPFITFGIYSIVWQVKTKNEMNKLGSEIPTAWLMIVPIVNIWWLWKYCEGVEKVTSDKMSGVLAFVLLFLLGSIGSAILQSEFNSVGDGSAVAAGPVPVATMAADPAMTPEAPAEAVAPTVTVASDVTPPAPSEPATVQPEAPSEPVAAPVEEANNPESNPPTPPTASAA